MVLTDIPFTFTCTLIQRDKINMGFLNQRQTNMNSIIEKKGYNDFWDEVLIKNCLYNNKSPQYYHWCKGFVSGFNEFMECMESPLKPFPWDEWKNNK